MPFITHNFLNHWNSKTKSKRRADISKTDSEFSIKGSHANTSVFLIDFDERIFETN